MLHKSNLHPYQDDAITALYEHDELLLICPMGGGKTVSALTAFTELAHDNWVGGGIVLAPKRVAAGVWRQEAALWDHLRGLRLQLVHGSAAQRSRCLAKDADLWIVGIDNTQWLTEELAAYDGEDPRFGILIIDEMSRYKAPVGKRARALSMTADRFKVRWGLTGTPMPNNEADLFQPARILTRRRIWEDNFAAWRMRYFIPDNPVTQYRWELREEWRDKIWDDVARFTHVVADDELPPQPELQLIEHWVDMPAEARARYDEMLHDLVIEFGPDFVSAENMGVAAGKLDQIAQGFVYENGSTGEVFLKLHDAKITELKEIVAGLGGQQAMITYWFKEDLAAIRGAYPDIHVLGDSSKAFAENAAIEMWNAGDVQLLAVHPASAGHGLNLQKSHAGQIIHYCPPWSTELRDQVRKRVARQGNQRAHVFEHLILARDTLDEVKRVRHTDKLARQSAFVEHARSRGVQV